MEYLHEYKNIIQSSLQKEVVQHTNYDIIPKELLIKNKKFTLTGVIAFEGDYVEVDPLVHYKAFVPLTNQWILFDGLLPPQQILENTPVEKIALLFYAEV